MQTRFPEFCSRYAAAAELMGWSETTSHEQGLLSRLRPQPAVLGVAGSQAGPQHADSQRRPLAVATLPFLNAKAIAHQLLGPHARFSDDHVLMKPAKVGAPTPWHQDEAFRDPKYKTGEISIWLALQSVDRVNGCMEFIPASNIGEVLPHRSPNGNGSVHALECFEGFDVDTAVPCPVPAGGCTIHTGRTLHFARPNRSDAPRYAYVLIFNLPPLPMRESRDFPWLADRQTQHAERNRRWRSHGGFAVEAVRWVRKLDPHDFERLLYDVRLARAAVARAFRH